MDIPQTKRGLLKFPNLHTPRLLLRKVELSDAKDFFEFASDEQVSRSTGWKAHQTLDKTGQVIGIFLKAYENETVAPWAIVTKFENKMIGICGFTELWQEHFKADLAYSLARTYWRKGYATEAVKAVLEYGFKEMGLHRIEAECDVENVASARVLEKAGMQLEGVLRETWFENGRFISLKKYSILRKEWESTQKILL